jgi:hypothetical protein
MKTVKEWFAQLPEPYGTDCMSAALHYDCIMDVRESLGDAIAMSIPSWPGLDIEDLIERANSGEFDTPAIPWPVEASWDNAPEWAYARASDMDGYCYFHGLVVRGKEYEPANRFCGKISNITGIDWRKTLEYRPR